MRVSGRLRPPGDKSITHRLLILGSLSRGRCLLRGALRSRDIQSKIDVLRLLGVRVEDGSGDILEVEGKGLRGLAQPTKALDCGNSGTTARFLIGVLAAYPYKSQITGDESLRARPMRRVTDPLTRMGARFEYERGDGLPVVVHGGELVELDYSLPMASAQVKSALLLAGLIAGVHVRIEEPAQSRDHTERLLAALGHAVCVEGGVIDFHPSGEIDEFDAQVAGDFSAASFLIGAATLADEGELILENVGANPTRLGLLSVLQRMGSQIEIRNVGTSIGEPVAEIVVRPCELRGVVVSPDEVPSLIDEIPVLAVLAARAQGETVFEGVGELAFKESDRLSLLASNLRSLGVEAESTRDSLVVTGTDKPLQGFVDTGGDHRIAMAFSVLAASNRSEIELSESDSPRVSYPDFFNHLRQIFSGDE